MAALPALQPALRDRLRCGSTRAMPRRPLASEPRCRHDVCDHRPGRVGLPLALAFADAGLSCPGCRQGPRAARRAADGGMPSRSRSRRQLAAHAARRCPPWPADAAQARRDPARRSARRVLAHRDRHGRHPPVLDDLLPHLIEGQLVVRALDGRAGTRPSSSPATSRSTAASVSARMCSSPMCRSGSSPTVPGGDRDAAGSSAASARRPASGAERRQLGAPIVQTTPGRRAGEDLAQHPALRDVRAAEPADDGTASATARTCST